MCIYFVKNYSCGHFADALQPTVFAHCRELDTCLRYWHDQSQYQPLEVSVTELEQLHMPLPCRPIWPIPFPGNKYLPVPKFDQYPRGLARPRADDFRMPEADPLAIESWLARAERENRLVEQMGSFRISAAYQTQDYQTSIVQETQAYQALYPHGKGIRSTRLPPFKRHKEVPLYPLSFVTRIINFDRARNRPNQPPNVIIYPHPTGCLRTPHEHCKYDPTNLLGLQCPWLLSTRTPWLYPGSTIQGRPYPRHEAAFLCDLNNRGGAVSHHMMKDPIGSEMTRLALNRDGSVGYIPPLVLRRLQNLLPEGPFPWAIPEPEPESEPAAAETAAEAPLQEIVEQESPPVGGDHVTDEAVKDDNEEGLLSQEGVSSDGNETLLGVESLGRLPGYRYPAPSGEVDWVSESGRTSETGARGTRDWHSDVGRR